VAIDAMRILEIAQLPMDPSLVELWTEVMDMVNASDDIEELATVITQLHQIADPEANRYDMAIMMYMGTHMGTLFLNKCKADDVEKNIEILVNNFSSKLAAAGFANVAKAKLDNSDKWTDGELSLYIAIAIAMQSGMSFDFLI